MTVTYFVHFRHDLQTSDGSAPEAPEGRYVTTRVYLLRGHISLSSKSVGTLCTGSLYPSFYRIKIT